MIASLDESIEGARVKSIEVFPKPEGVPMKRKLKALRQVDLVDVSCPDVASNTADRR
jgi:hypothetical protein